MKNFQLRVLLMGVLTLAMSAGNGLSQEWKGKTLSPPEIEKRWGKEQFDIKKFRTAEPSERAKMAASILKQQKFLKTTASEVEKELGRPDGFFGSERIPAYVLEDGGFSKKPSWQLVFYLDEKGHVSDIFVQENGSELPYRASQIKKMIQRK